MSFPYYEQIANMINNNELLLIEEATHAKDSKNQLREVYFILHFANGKVYNIYKGKAKPQRLESVFYALKKKGLAQ